MITYILRHLEERGLVLVWNGNRFWASARPRDLRTPTAAAQSGIRLVVANGLYGTTAEAIAMQVEAVAAQGRSARPVEHWVLSYGPEECVTDERIAADARDFLHKLGFGDTHVWVAVVHEDGGALHVHVGVCITDPVTRRAHSCPRPVRAGERAVAEISTLRGVPIVPGRHNADLVAGQRGGQALPAPPRRRYARKPRGGRPWAEAVASLICGAAERSATWVEFEIALALDGIAIVDHPTPRRSRLAFAAGHAAGAPWVSGLRAGWPASHAVARFGYHQPRPETAPIVADLLLAHGLVAADGRRPERPAGPRPLGRPPRPRQPAELAEVTGRHHQPARLRPGPVRSPDRPSPARLGLAARREAVDDAEIAARMFALVAIGDALERNGAPPDAPQVFARWRRAAQARIRRRVARAQHAVTPDLDGGGDVPGNGAEPSPGGTPAAVLAAVAGTRPSKASLRPPGTTGAPPDRGGGTAVAPPTSAERHAGPRANTTRILADLVGQLRALTEVCSDAIASAPALGSLGDLAALARRAGDDGGRAANAWLEERLHQQPEADPTVRTAATACREMMIACREAAASLRVVASPHAQRFDDGERSLLEEALAAARVASGWVPVAETEHPLATAARSISEIPRLKTAPPPRSGRRGRWRSGGAPGGRGSGLSRPPPSRGGPVR
ncbi:relaxase/mobilization nuclease domain-containing protein [Falsiroseomonas sp. E2-1-a4]|uniref:relaxase/mobilization nuclease domain-containing protein n=1 Tax=Falsiroseomonas sp. E2-1-a4 TaxID=3239299 RepID=UPI003F3E4FCA